MKRDAAKNRPDKDRRILLRTSATPVPIGGLSCARQPQRDGQISGGGTGPFALPSGGMGERNYLVRGISGAGKTTAAEELERRGHQVAHGDRVLARTSDPVTGRLLEEPIAGWSPEQKHRHHIWDADQVQTLVDDHSHPLTFSCGGSRNSASLLDLFDEVFVLEIDIETLNRGWTPARMNSAICRRSVRWCCGFT
jgi:hypothetical protein